MNKKVLSLILCLVMLFSLMPVFNFGAMAEDGGPEGIETADGYAQAGNRTSWKMSDVVDWQNNYHNYTQYAVDGTLYVKVGENDYREVIIAEDNYYYRITDKTDGESYKYIFVLTDGKSYASICSNTKVAYALTDTTNSSISITLLRPLLAKIKIT